MPITLFQYSGISIDPPKNIHYGEINPTRILLEETPLIKIEKNGKGQESSQTDCDTSLTQEKKKINEAS
jgi:hypothetical protein